MAQPKGQPTEGCPGGKPGPSGLAASCCRSKICADARGEERVEPREGEKREPGKAQPRGPAGAAAVDVAPCSQPHLRHKVLAIEDVGGEVWLHPVQVVAPLADGRGAVLAGPPV